MMWDIYQDGSKFKHSGGPGAGNAVLTARKKRRGKKTVGYLTAVPRLSAARRMSSKVG